MKHTHFFRWLYTIVFMAVYATPIEIQAGQNVVVLLDDSGSMKQPMRTDGGRVSRIQAAKDALSKVVQGLPDDAQLGILLLNNEGRGNAWLIPLGPLSTTKALPKIERIHAHGGTPLGAQIKIAAEALLDLRQMQIYGEYRLLVITDGEATDANLLEAYLPDILSRGLTFDVIGVDMAANHSLAGRAHSYRKANDVQSFEKALKEIFAESTSQPDEQGASDFALIADLPDEFAKEILTTLSIPKNKNIGFASQPNPSNQNTTHSTTPSNNQPPPPLQPPATAMDGFIGILLALPCCFLIVIVFVVVVMVSQGKNRKK